MQQFPAAAHHVAQHPITNDSHVLGEKEILGTLTWESRNAPINSRQWPLRKKWATTSIVSAFTYLSSVSTPMISPTLDQIGQDLLLTTEIQHQLTMSIIVLAFAVGPVILAPLSEVYGRSPMLQLSNFFFLVWNVACAFSKNKSEMFAFRFLSGIGGSAAMAVGEGTVSHCWEPERRGTAIAIYSLTPLLGPVIGPISGAWIAEKSTWRWVFWSTSIFGATVQVLGLCFLQESFAPVILQHHTKRLGVPLQENIEATKSIPRLLALGTSLIRPARLLTTQPVVQMIALYMVYVYGLFYLFLSTFPGVWQGVHHESTGIAGLNYISLGVGFVLGVQIGGRLKDLIYVTLKARNFNRGRPESRIPLMIIGSYFVSTGIFWYGWSVQARAHWIVPNFGIAVFASGCIVCLQCMQAYIVDNYTRFAASAMAAAVVVRSLAGFGLPLFAPYLYNRLDYGWGNSVLGLISIGLGIPAPLGFWF
ncbi:MFS transporter [Aspergillus affinis]|uniref:MFS transporter n=1 Tax=Aspergillus affinis TaxID=1070780 RepID=UPI0022FDB6A4|nr:MFS general substrate transporter [Aspergillus affinis]KAI9045029.1 MFS general substrate transporter [Aspergillus affinis]